MNSVGPCESEYSLLDLRKYISKIQTGMLSTLKEEKIWGRPMHCCLDENQNSKKIWIFSKTSNSVVRELRLDQNCFIGFADTNNNTFLSIQGIANVIHDKTKMRELWNPIMKAWYPKGLDDAEMCLLEFEILSAEVWNGPSSKIVQLGQMITSIVRGEEYSGPCAGNARVNLD